MLDKRDFTDTVKMEMAIADIRRYQHAYITVNEVKGIMVKWKKGWYCVINHGHVSFHRPLAFRNMIDALEARIKEKNADITKGNKIGT